MPYDPSKDPYRATLPDSRTFARKGAAVTPSDTNDLASYAKGLLVVAAGDVKFLPSGNADAAPLTGTFVSGQVIPYQVRRVFATGTTATVWTLED